ncbi:hypothetical protein IQ289_07445 [Burkholderia sp. R-70006]|uniref:hypothetical protein n=1 Tax=Paraburkholderia domus TaxID=2793075 RepID=UPI0019135A99|nr:hypothetical protein [Paraburkholderia domus]MBK5048241.1 hypothetical protein [Burkholderia sp. R-70006]
MKIAGAKSFSTVTAGNYYALYTKRVLASVHLPVSFPFIDNSAFPVIGINPNRFHGGALDMTNPARIFYLRIGFSAVSLAIVQCRTGGGLAPI